jgi:nitroreductase
MDKYFEQLVLTRQATRQFNDKPLEKEIVEKIANVARLAPSACNSQPWKMYVVTSTKALEKTAVALGAHGHNKFLNKAKAFIVVAEQQATLKEGVTFDRNHFVKYDIGEILAYVTLCAESLGVKSCIIGMVDQSLIKDAVGLKDGERCNVAVALGYSDIQLREKVRKPLDQSIEMI